MSKENDSSVSLNKFISSQGICSRREADRLIESGKVMLNGKKAEKGNRVEPGDKVKVKGKLLKSNPPRHHYIALNKPKGIVCTTSKKDKDNIIDFIGYNYRIFPIGRLDKDSEGLILLTNDGDIVNKILRASNEHEKEYIVEVDRKIDDNFLHHMRKGVPILNTITRPAQVEKIDNHTFKIILTQGLNRQIRRMTEALGYNVTALRRVRVMNIELADLATGKWRKLFPSELKKLKAALSESSKTSPHQKNQE